MIDSIFQRHEEVILFYSGGKDSLTLLLALKPYWERVHIVWADTGNQFPEVIEHMAKVRKMVSGRAQFTTLKGNQPKYFLEHGFPVNVVSIEHTRLGQSFFGEKPITVCSRYDCCQANMWGPMQAFVAAVKPTCVLRADRKNERLKGPTVENGVEYCFPLWDWSGEQIMKFLEKHAGDLLEERHRLEHGSSLDCQVCTALRNIPERLEYIKKNHPELHEKTVKFYEHYKQAVLNELDKIEVK